MRFLSLFRTAPEDKQVRRRSNSPATYNVVYEGTDVECEKALFNSGKLELQGCQVDGDESVTFWYKSGAAGEGEKAE